MPKYLFAQVGEIPSEYWIGAAAVVGLLMIFVLFQRLRRRRRVALPPPLDLNIKVSALGDHGPPAAAPSLELYNLPVRLAAVILAPTGRGSELPAGMDCAALVDHIVPGLAQIVELHKPLVRKWAPQLSTQGFSHTLFTNVPLPGDHGKGTPWSVVAGRFEAGPNNILAGLVLSADKPNSLGQFVIERPGQWLDLLRIRRH